jgi:DNA-binding NarL/FixJ family response regulator
MKTKILLVDDHQLIRDGLRLILQREDDFEVVGEAANETDALDRIPHLSPDLILMDVRLGEADGIQASLQILSRFPNVRILILSGISDAGLVNRAIQAGVNGYLLKTSAAEELTRAIREVMAGKSCLCPEVAHALVSNYKVLLSGKSSSAQSLLTEREQEVLKHTAEGLRIKDIAAALKISVKTVETHRANLMKKLGYTSSAELTRYAVREGICPL